MVSNAPMEPSHKWLRVNMPREKAKMLIAFEEIRASSRSLSLIAGPLSAPGLLLVTPSDCCLGSRPVAVAAVSSACLSSSSSLIRFFAPVA